MTDTEPAYEWHPLHDAASTYAQALSLAAGDSGATWQEALDLLPDHNQTMIDSIEAEAPSVAGAITELMEADSEYARVAWPALVNHVFELAKAIYEGVEA